MKAFASFVVAASIPALLVVASLTSSAAASTRHTIWPQTRPEVLTGQGARIASVSLPRNGPLVVWAAHNGQANFIVDLVSANGGEQNLFNEIGPYQGETAWAEAARGRYRVRVEADGAWELEFLLPAPARQAPKLPGTFAGHGAHVIQVWVPRSFQPVVTASHNGQENFIVDIVAFNGEDQNLFNEIGEYTGQTLIDHLAAGAYLVVIHADGAWHISFTR